MPVVEPEARPRLRVRRRNEAAVERAGTAVKGSDKWRAGKREQETRNGKSEPDCPTTVRFHRLITTCGWPLRRPSEATLALPLMLDLRA